MPIEIDQSGKLEQLDTLTVVAVSNSQSDYLILKAGVKRKIILYLRKYFDPKIQLIVWFASTIYHLVKGKVNYSDLIIIDEEYTGKDVQLIKILENLLVKHKTWRGVIPVKKIGKHSNAHNIAWSNHRKPKYLTYKTLSLTELIKTVEEIRKSSVSLTLYKNKGSASLAQPATLVEPAVPR